MQEIWSIFECNEISFCHVGHILSPKGIKIDTARVEAIQKINAPRNKNEIQSFFFFEKVHSKFCRNCQTYNQYAQEEQ